MEAWGKPVIINIDPQDDTDESDVEDSGPVGFRGEDHIKVMEWAIQLLALVVDDVDFADTLLG